MTEPAALRDEQSNRAASAGGGPSRAEAPQRRQPLRTTGFPPQFGVRSGVKRPLSEGPDKGVARGFVRTQIGFKKLKPTSLPKQSAQGANDPGPPRQQQRPGRVASLSGGSASSDESSDSDLPAGLRRSSREPAPAGPTY